MMRKPKRMMVLLLSLLIIFGTGCKRNPSVLEICPSSSSQSSSSSASVPTDTAELENIRFDTYYLYVNGWKFAPPNLETRGKYYYVNQLRSFELSCYNPETRRSTEVVKSSVLNYTLSDSHIYYMTPYGLHKCDLDGKNKSVVLNVYIDSKKIYNVAITSFLWKDHQLFFALHNRDYQKTTYYIYDENTDQTETFAQEELDPRFIDSNWYTYGVFYWKQDALFSVYPDAIEQMDSQNRRYILYAAPAGSEILTASYYEDLIYFVVKEKDNCVLYSVDTKGRVVSESSTFTGRASALLNDRLYLYDSDSLYSVDPNGNTELLTKLSIPVKDTRTEVHLYAQEDFLFVYRVNPEAFYDFSMYSVDLQDNKAVCFIQENEDPFSLENIQWREE